MRDNSSKTRGNTSGNTSGNNSNVASPRSITNQDLPQTELYNLPSNSLPGTGEWFNTFFRF